MKKESMKISINAEKLRAVKTYMEKKEIDLEDELADQLEKLYDKYVPANVREYIDDKQEEEEEEEKKRKSKKSTIKQVESNNPSIIQE